MGQVGGTYPHHPYIYKSYTFLPILDVNQPLYFTKFYIGFGTILYQLQNNSKGSIVIYISDVNVAILDM
jgi:hypothetical protein